MEDDMALFAQINVQLGTAETAGDRDWLDGVLAPQPTFRRANGAVQDWKGYLAAVALSDPRETDIDSIVPYGDRAVVSCIVTMTVQSSNGEKRRLHNLRSTRGDPGRQILGWANAPMKSVPVTPGGT